MKIDWQLISSARRLITGANVHRVNTLIFQYQMAVRVSNDDETGGLDIRAQQYERELRALIAKMRMDQHNGVGRNPPL